MKETKNAMGFIILEEDGNIRAVEVEVFFDSSWISNYGSVQKYRCIECSKEAANPPPGYKVFYTEVDVRSEVIDASEVVYETAEQAYQGHFKKTYRSLKILENAFKLISDSIADAKESRFGPPMSQLLHIKDNETKNANVIPTMGV